MSVSSPRINAMINAVRYASKQLMRDFNELQISNVKSADFINKSYSRSKETICNLLYDYRNDYDFIIEDQEGEEQESDYAWFIGPIEGKENFASCIVYFSTLVCLVHKGKVIAAVIDAPALRETFWAEEKRGALLEDSKSRYIKMRVKSREGGLIDVSGSLLSKLPPSKNIRSLGSTALGFAHLAAGRYNGIIYSEISKYKISLGKLFLQESSGRLKEDNGLVIAGDTQLI
ncbi:MAG: inositol monophosphatase family protein [Wolbachia endosymbiont of Tyrophagus putrescentiae]|nr:inositol monophosphatase family protein [Wolbachia endosymbiont of Tyrophagus putrescentiae]